MIGRDAIFCVSTDARFFRSFCKKINDLLNLIFTKSKLEDILSNHSTIEGEISKQIRPLQHFKNYLKYGYYPYFLDGIDSYHQKLMAGINLTLEYDLPSAQHIEYGFKNRIPLWLFGFTY